ncbi:class I SAM-dependent methyltransferase [Streptomyces triticagri]|uniref:Class I SAM-dependent methyltransferase n=1 Tax=Streptomyces triticagri TaxID=2293568 RepID=A0A372LV90_9ACTN|nr:class I SAM-dependent methyltransferase [Streptomyces triticagri]RFU82290.1 class I SAM-dependent methyltransferase [Streptomyces triticagri]
MPTLPARQPDPDPAETHRHRSVAESFGAEAARYDRARPRYPQALLRRIADSAPGPDVLDVGCGTGIVARQLAAEGCRVQGLDADERMAEVARANGLDVEVGRFEDWAADGRSFDAVVAGQTWHWVDPATGADRAARLLRPRGTLALFWNAGEPPAALTEAFAEVFRRVAPDSLALRGISGSAVDGYGLMCETAADGIRGTGAFAEPERWREDWEFTYSREAWLDQLPTTGAFTPLTAEQRAEALAGVGEAIDAMGGRFTMRYATLAVVASRLP